MIAVLVYMSVSLTLLRVKINMRCYQQKLCFFQICLICTTLLYIVSIMEKVSSTVGLPKHILLFYHLLFCIFVSAVYTYKVTSL